MEPSRHTVAKPQFKLEMIERENKWVPLRR